MSCLPNTDLSTFLLYGNSLLFGDRHRCLPSSMLKSIHGIGFDKFFRKVFSR